MCFAIIGDYGVGDEDEAAVANLVASWNPEFIVTVGDNYYTNAGGTGTDRFARSVGAFYGRWLDESFYPSLGNHDYDASPAPATYLSYFSPPRANLASTSGNTRYYDFVRGPIHFFVLNSNPQEPDGIDSTSIQARWLHRRLSASKSKWNVVIDHHPPYSSDDEHGPNAGMRWPFAEWGADAVVSGHVHTYERIMRDHIVYFVNGIGGASRYNFGAHIQGSAARYRDTPGAQRVTITGDALVFECYATGGKLVDRYTLKNH